MIIIGAPFALYTMNLLSKHPCSSDAHWWGVMDKLKERVIRSMREEIKYYAQTGLGAWSPPNKKLYL